MSDKRTPDQVIRSLLEQEQSRCAELSGRDARLAKALAGWRKHDFKDWYWVKEDWSEGLDSGRWAAPSDFFRADYKKVMEAYVPPRYRAAFLYIIDRLALYQFSSSLSRRTMRTRRWLPHLDRIPDLLLRCSELFYYGVGLEDLLRERLDEEQLDFLHRPFRGGISPLLLAAELDLGDQSVREAVEEAILSETNTVRVTMGIIRGILYSADQELYGLLGRFLLAARLQEGVRQAICESMDCGTMEAFLSLFDVILDHDLLRFSSVKRAVATWSGLYSETSLDRLTAKEARLIRAGLDSEAKRRELLSSQDPVEVHIGLWAMGAYEVEDALAALAELARKGDRPQLLAASYYLSTVEDDGLRTKTAAVVLAAHQEDPQLFACYLPSYLPQVGSILSDALPSSRKDELKPPRPLAPIPYLPSPAAAEEGYRVLERAYQDIPSKGLCFDPCIFPWHQVKVTRLDVLERMCVLAWMLRDQAKLEACAQALTGAGASQYDYVKQSLMKLAFLSGDSPARRRALVSILKNGDSASAELAFLMLDKLSLCPEDYAALEGLLSSRRDALRSRADQLLLKQGEAALSRSVERLLGSKNELERTAGLDLVRMLGETAGRKDLYAGLCRKAREAIPAPTDKERILLGELTGGVGETEARQIADTPGFGIYDPAARIQDRSVPYDLAQIRAVYACPEAELVRLLQALDELIQANARREYTTEGGQEMLLGSGYLMYVPTLDRLPFPELWRAFYETQVRAPELMLQLAVYADLVLDGGRVDMAEWAKQTALIQLFGTGLLRKSLPYRFAPLSLTYRNHVRVIADILREEYAKDVIPFSLAAQAVSALADKSTPHNALYQFRSPFQGSYPAYSHPLFRPFLHRLDRWADDEAFAQSFFIQRRLQSIYDQTKDHGTQNGHTLVPESWYLKAWQIGLISKDAFYKALFTQFQPNTALAAVTGQLSRRARLPRRGSYRFGGDRFFDCLRPGEGQDPDKADEAILALSETIYRDLVPPMLSVELRRGDPATVFSRYIPSIHYVPGADYLVRILAALGDQVLDRGGYYPWQQEAPGRQAALSHLLAASCPAPGETAADLARALAGISVSPQRLCDVAMRAPQWIDLLEEHLGWPGLKSGCCYFIAHMNESMDEQTKAVVAKYTPLTAEELRDGAFDADWFREAYGQLGPQRFQALYQSARYISSGTKHARARKFADAALGKLDVDRTEAQLSAKRNQDLLMAYGAIPLGGEADLLRRYQFLQQFAKESKQFGAQRRASEAKAVELALKNLSVNAGYADVTRLILRMESCLAASLAPCLEWRDIGAFSVRIQVDEFGKNALVCRKGDKLLKSLPAKLGKDEAVKALKGVHKQLSDQFSRTRRMLEQAMEDRTAFSAGELLALTGSPVTRPMVESLVFLRGEDLGYLRAGGLTDPAGRALPLDPGEELVLAHPLDLYRAGCWSEYQADLFRRQVRQPFRQVFRELYLKLPEEGDKDRSLLFSGNQIQPQKAKACLRERRWVADYEQGLQKIYYKAGIAVELCAMCDWFSPAEVEPPTLDWVVFSDRRTGRAMKLSEVPDLIYTEVMRDVDLAVSVAHAGGVDPETSHSTVEMRRALIAFNLPLFKLTNVELEGSHALIHGALGEYSVHLGSGVVHLLGGPMLNVLPVHSQSRGRLFLPFLDSDPKTAEILSKVVLFAEDRKIKDPFILEQIR